MDLAVCCLRKAIKFNHSLPCWWHTDSHYDWAYSQRSKFQCQVTFPAYVQDLQMSQQLPEHLLAQCWLKLENVWTCFFMPVLLAISDFMSPCMDQMRSFTMSDELSVIYGTLYGPYEVIHHVKWAISDFMAPCMDQMRSFTMSDELSVISWHLIWTRWGHSPCQMRSQALPRVIFSCDQAALRMAISVCLSVNFGEVIDGTDIRPDSMHLS